MASYRAWMDVFQQAYRAPDRVPELACPNCGARQLHMVFVIFGSRGHRANAVFWCGRCLEGMPADPSAVPAGCQPMRHEDADVPNFRIVPPAGRSEHAPGE